MNNKAFFIDNTNMVASKLPNSAFIIWLRYGYKKRRGSFIFRAYPWPQAFALPRFKDKQRKPAHAKCIYVKFLCRCYYLHTRECYNTPSQTLRCITSVKRFKFAKFECHR